MFFLFFSGVWGLTLGSVACRALRVEGLGLRVEGSGSREGQKSLSAKGSSAVSGMYFRSTGFSDIFT